MPTIQLGTLEIYGIEEILRHRYLDVDIYVRAWISIGYRQMYRHQFCIHTHI